MRAPARLTAVLCTSTLFSSMAIASDPNVSLINVDIVEVASGFEWGYHAGVKQPLGAVKNDLNLYQLSKSDWPNNTPDGNPDYIFWVDESDLTNGVQSLPTGAIPGLYTYPGGQVGFADDGTIYYIIGGRFNQLPIDLYESDNPYDITSFTRVLDDFAPGSGNTTPTLVVDGDKVLCMWREGSANARDVMVRMNRYDLNTGFGTVEATVDIGQGVPNDPTYGLVGIEQYWTRHDPRHDVTMITWEFLDWNSPSDKAFGSNPLLYSDDNGDTWKRADGTTVTTPLTYPDINDQIVPFDHIDEGENSAWYVRDVGIGPDGTFWLTTPGGDGQVDDGWSLYFWRYNGTAWEGQEMTGGMLGQSKPHACGVTKDYIVLLYSEYAERNVLKAVVSCDDGATWSDPIIIETLDADRSITWVGFVQPDDDYTDNSARFFYGYTRQSFAVAGTRYRNNIKWVKFDVDAADLCAENATAFNFNVQQGTLDSGDLMSLDASDDDSVVVEGELTGGGFKYRTRTIVKMTSPFTDVSRLDLTIETGANDSLTGMPWQKFFLWNFDTSSWTLIGQGSQPKPDTINEFCDISNPNAYVNDTTGEIRVRVFDVIKETKAPMGLFNRIDHVEVRVSPAGL